MAYVIAGPSEDQDSPGLAVRRGLTVRREPKVTTTSLRALYRDSQSPPQIHTGTAKRVPSTPQLPPTPPSATAENSDREPVTTAPGSDFSNHRDATPPPAKSPPTPDNTPPRRRPIYHGAKRLAVKPSLASTRAESFKTAQEELFSDDEHDALQHHSTARRLNMSPPQIAAQVYQAVTLQDVLRTRVMPNISNGANGPVFNTAQTNRDDTQPLEGARNDHVLTTPQLQLQSASDQDLTDDEETPHPTPRQMDLDESDPFQTPAADIRRGPSLRDRLAKAHQLSETASTEKFAEIIGWSNSVVTDSGNESPSTQRYSMVSASSPEDTFVVDKSAIMRRATTLRHMRKNDSLRSVSSPLPTSPRTSVYSMNDSPHRLIHKKARLSNQNRWSGDSDMSRAFSIASSAALPRNEVIRVAIIPERTSSTHSSSSSPRQSVLPNNSPVAQHNRKGSDGHFAPSSWQRRRTISDSSNGNQRLSSSSDPRRSSSISSPTSTTSKANSITSEHLRLRRQEAEVDLRKTLDLMASDRLIASLKDYESDSKTASPPHRLSVDSPVTPSSRDSRCRSSTSSHYLTPMDSVLRDIEPGTREWAALRPQSMSETPFSQPSFQSNSPEINEARAVNLFPHNNRSLQIIEPNKTQESKAVRAARGANVDELESQTPAITGSPLRNPRPPPEPPQLQLCPPTPLDDIPQQNTGFFRGRRGGSLTRPSPQDRQHSSFLKTMTRSLSLNSPRNRKPDQDLENKLHPTWQPKTSWDDENARPLRDDGRQLQTQVFQSLTSSQRSLTLSSSRPPSSRNTLSSPTSLLRRFSSRRQRDSLANPSAPTTAAEMLRKRNKHTLTKQSSTSSLAKIPAARKLQKSQTVSLAPGSSKGGSRQPFGGVGSLQDKILQSRARKEDEKREARREELRRSIGTNVIMRSDSRFPPPAISGKGAEVY